MVALTGFLSSLIVFFSLYSPFASIFHFEGAVPQNLGVSRGHLTSCPQTPNCVVSNESADETHYIKPMDYDSDRATAKDTLLKVLSVVPNTVVVEETEDYIRTESRSKIMGFVDDGEFYFPEDKSVIEVRSASRLGESDLGVNRRRLEQIRLAIADYNSRG
ncbi:DUF1499 domain-containing protein [Cyanobacterium stanieri LEGE 03274]|uniref:DUF1499 domain-containing protein n=1 Tax=Cyanobacterium stanieri LEGE 03274 TaxID=1828756 RepID=A0ABR9V770_9CHRO|nr:DUF1499 domain-containing protein [Cyanobacterium stanieri]MBE9223750.1 DUF1499 domain-containing protein [Cyanobacterium stanieri LEGE 03274]